MVVNLIQYFSIILELVIAVLAIKMIANKKSYGWFFLITFGIYVFYDLIKLKSIWINPLILNVLFLIASVSALILALKLSKKEVAQKSTKKR